jgi:quercetin dioxygenase-like cupin family protein
LITKRTGLGLTALAAFVAACAFPFFPQTSSAQPSNVRTPDPDWHLQSEALRVVNIVDEPRHRTVHVDGLIRLLDVQINPGDTTLPHTHDAAILYTFISNGAGPLYGRVSSITSYVEEQYTHRVSNEGPGLFRIIALANYGEALPESHADRPAGLVTQPQLENPWFRSYRIELEPGQSGALQTHHNPSVVVQVTEGLIHVSRPDGITSELTQMGDWAWREPGAVYQISNAGVQTVSVVVNEARRDSH